MMDFLTALTQATKSYSLSKDLEGRSFGLQWGICTDNQDPLNMGRVKSTLASVGGQSQTDWLMRIVPFYGFSSPVIPVGSTILVGFIGGDPHKGAFIGLPSNNLNPAKESDQITLRIGETEITIRDGAIAITGISSVSLNGKEVATIGATDDEGDDLVTKGWT